MWLFSLCGCGEEGQGDKPHWKFGVLAFPLPCQTGFSSLPSTRSLSCPPSASLCSVSSVTHNISPVTAHGLDVKPELEAEQ